MELIKLLVGLVIVMTWFWLIVVIMQKQGRVLGLVCVAFLPLTYVFAIVNFRTCVIPFVIHVVSASVYVSMFIQI